jgi:3-hydroxyacyl-[acyl-carrier-protein] dehydratase
LDKEVLEALIRSGKKTPLWRPAASTTEIDIGRAGVERMLEHRHPFLFVDHLSAVDLVQTAIRGERAIDPADPLFVGHFPNQPLYPGVLQLETMGQFGLCLLHLARSGSTSVAADAMPAPVRALRIHHALFLREVRPGDQLTVLARVVDCNAYTGVCSGQILCEGEICCFAVMEVYFVN